MRQRVFTALCSTLLLMFAAATEATIITYTAALSGLNEAPANASPGTGFAVVTLDDVLNTMRVQVSFADLLGTTTASHIHCCTTIPLTGTAGVATTTPTFAGFPLGVTSGSYDNTLDMTLASSYNPAFVTAHGGTTVGARAFLFSGMALNESYLNIHTSLFGGGEIRGFLTAVPEPATLALMGVGLALLSYRRHRVA